MRHFVSTSCGGERCSMCSKPATHKVGEEIMHDEPCMSCGKRYVSREIDPKGAEEAVKNCPSFFHLAGPHAQRHNLTAYVCCGCFTKILGRATGCPTTDGENDANQ
jgi:hypothetical protein